MNLDEVDVLFSQEQIKARVKELGQQITRDYQGQNLLIIGVLKGAFIFMADLIREINLPLEVDFISVSSYGTSTVSSGEVRITKDLDRSVEGKSVLLVEDIVDTGLTLNYLEEIFKKSGIQVDALTRWVQAIERKGQAIIYGPARHHVIGTPAKTQLPDPTSGADIRSPWNGIGHY